MRIGILTQYYPPETGAPQARLSELAQRFVASGDEVFVLTAMPSYPIGRLYDGYRGIWRRENRDGVTVLRTWAFPTRSVGMLPRLWNYLSFVISSFIGGVVALPKLDFLLTESPPLFLGISGWLLSLTSRARWIFNVSDLWPESAVRLGIVRDGLALRMAEALESFCYKHAWLITGQSKEILDDISRRNPAKAVYHLSNGVDTDLFHPGSRIPGHFGSAGKGSECVAIYAGLHGIAQGLTQLLDAAAELKGNCPLRLVLIGDGPEKQALIDETRRRGLDNITFLEPCSRAEMPQVVASADIAVIPLRTRLPGAVPSKIYEAMGASLPIVLVAEGEPAEIIRNNGCGLAVNPGDTAGLVNALRTLAEDPWLRERLGRAGRQAACVRFNRATIVRNFHDYLEAAVASEAPPSTVTRSLLSSLETCFERLICGVALIVLSPLIVFIAVAIALEDGFPVFFHQERVGRYRAPFEIVKFRTMRTAPGNAITVAGDSRITRIGSTLRRYKLDEIPQLWNVIRGDMSLVGPRPEVPRYVDLRNPDWETVLSARPGITCISSVLYRDEERLLATADDPEAFYRETILPRKLRLSAEYLRKRTPLTDLRLILATIVAALRPSQRLPDKAGLWP